MLLKNRGIRHVYTTTEVKGGTYTTDIGMEEGIERLIITIEDEALTIENAKEYKAELILTGGNNNFKKKNTLKLYVGSIDQSGLSVLGVFKRFCHNHFQDERPRLELKEKDTYVERMLKLSDMHRQFEITYTPQP